MRAAHGRKITLDTVSMTESLSPLRNVTVAAACVLFAILYHSVIASSVTARAHTTYARSKKQGTGIPHKSNTGQRERSYSMREAAATH